MWNAFHFNGRLFHIHGRPLKNPVHCIDQRSNKTNKRSQVCYIYHQDHLHSSNRSTVPWRPRIVFSSCSSQVQWSRYLCIFVFVSVLILAMIQDQALVASRSKHFLVETKDQTLSPFERLFGKSDYSAHPDGPWKAPRKGSNAGGPVGGTRGSTHGNHTWNHNDYSAHHPIEAKEEYKSPPKRK